jgi:hypothetical protein
MKRHVLGLLAIITCSAPFAASAMSTPVACDRNHPEAMLSYLHKTKPTLEQARAALPCIFIVGPRDATTMEIRRDNSRLYPTYDETRQHIVGGSFH